MTTAEIVIRCNNKSIIIHVGCDGYPSHTGEEILNIFSRYDRFSDLETFISECEIYTIECNKFNEITRDDNNLLEYDLKTFLLYLNSIGKVIDFYNPPKEWQDEADFTYIVDLNLEKILFYKKDVLFLEVDFDNIEFHYDYDKLLEKIK